MIGTELQSVGVMGARPRALPAPRPPRPARPAGRPFLLAPFAACRKFPLRSVSSPPV